jgi:hypothetical protein
MPNHWRAGLGRHRIGAVDQPPAPEFLIPPESPFSYLWAPIVVTAPPAFVIPAQPQYPISLDYWGKFQPAPSMSAPLNFTIPEAQGWRPWWVPATPPGDDSDDNKNEDEAPEPPGELPGGVASGAGYLFTGVHLTLNVVTEYTPNQVLRAKAAGFPFMTYTCAAQATVKSVIAAIKGAAGMSMTQLFEVGDGQFIKGTTIKKGEDRAGDTLEKLGWADAGNKVKAPIWVVIQ